MNKIVPFKSRLRPWPAQQRKPRRRPPAWWPLVALIVLAGILYGGAVLREDEYSLGERSPAGSSDVKFSLCRRAGQLNCVVDGDTFHLGSEIIRIADINTPEVHEAKCDAEAALGRRATQRLIALLNEGPFNLEHVGSRDHDKYGRDLRIVSRDGRSLGDILVAEGLAERWTGSKRNWCR